MVTIDNVEEYIDLVTDFCLNAGIRRQMEALKGKLFCLISFSVNMPSLDAAVWAILGCFLRMKV